jgi:hypothetical protein
LSHGNARTAEEVNQLLLDLAMEASIGRPVYDDAECHHVYREAELEVDASNRHHTMLAAWHPTPSLAAMLHQEVVLARAQRRQATADCIARRAWVDAWKAAMDIEAGPSNTPPASRGDNDHLF